jgi:hypothetical protein
LEDGASTVFPCGRGPRSIRTPTLPHGKTWPETVSHSPVGVKDDKVSLGVLLCGRLPSVIGAGVTPHGKTVEAPYTKLGRRTVSQLYSREQFAAKLLEWQDHDVRTKRAGLVPRVED